jgi:hypothetical protein
VNATRVDRVALVATALTAAVHLAVANRYDLFRDELYFIVCGRHPAFGYADQPPLVPILAAAGAAFGPHAWLVRLPSVLAAAALVWVTVALARLLGARTAGAVLAALGAACVPVLAGLTATLNTTTFEPLAWTLVAYALARAALRDDPRALVWGGVVAGVALEAKYGIALWLVALALGILAAGPRALFARPALWLGIVLAIVIALPSVVWQAAHGWPFAELVRSAHEKDTATAPLAFIANQLAITNPALAPLWSAGIIAPFVRADLRALRFIAIAFVITAAVTIAGGGKDYYLAPAYPPLAAIGAVALERAVRGTIARATYVALVIAFAALIAPLALPILDPPALLAYQRALHLTPQQQERADEGDAMPSTFADMLGWHAFVAEVARAWAAIPVDERAHTAILVDNYGEAAALDVYGEGLPPALSGHNQYAIWALRGQAPTNVLRVQRHPERLAPYCRSVTPLGTTQAQYARAFENGRSILFCRGLHPPLERIWPDLIHFD